MRPLEENVLVLTFAREFYCTDTRHSVRWEATFTGNANLSDLRKAVKDPTDQNPCTSGLRSICWKVGHIQRCYGSSLKNFKAFLLFENLDRSTWTKTLSDSRSAYTSLRDHFLRHIEHPDDLTESDPLTENETVSKTDLCGTSPAARTSKKPSDLSLSP